MVTSKIRFFVTVNTRLSAQLQGRVEICFGAFYQVRGGNDRDPLDTRQSFQRSVRTVQAVYDLKDM